MNSPFKHGLPGQSPPPGRMPPERQISGVHEAQTEPAPYLDELEQVTTETAMLVGSIPIAALTLHFEPMVCLGSGETLAYEVHPTCAEGGFSGAADLFSRAQFEHRIGELGRVLRSQAFDRSGGRPLLLAVHREELNEGWLIRPDDPLCTYDGNVYLQLAQANLSKVCRHVLSEVSARREVSLVLDEFGDGPSSIAQLIELQPVMVKLASTLTVGIESDPRRRAAVEQVAIMCGTLGATVVAKGIRTPAALDALMDCGVGFAQGPIVGEPSPDFLPGAGQR